MIFGSTMFLGKISIELMTSIVLMATSLILFIAKGKRGILKVLQGTMDMAVHMVTMRQENKVLIKKALK